MIDPVALDDIERCLAERTARSRAMDEARFPRLNDIKTHPVLDCIPLMNEAEFARLVWSIRKIGLVVPIGQDESGRIIDGRCRFLACEIADVEPRLAAPKDGSAALVFAKNAARRHLNVGQRAIITALVERIPDDGFADYILAVNLTRRHLGRSELHIIDARVEEPDFPETLVTDEARLIVRYNDLAERVGRGLSLAEAYDLATQRERETAKQAEVHRRLVQLRREAPFIAAQVDDGGLTIDQALAQAEETAAAPLLADHVRAIHALGRRMIDDTVEIGRRLAECRRLVRRDWTGWLHRELGISDRSALNFIRVYELAAARSENFSDLDLPVSGLYLLAQPSTPESVRDDVFQRVAAGDAVSVADIRREIGGESPDADGRLRELAKIVRELADERPNDALVRQLQSLVAKIEGQKVWVP